MLRCTVRRGVVRDGKGALHDSVGVVGIRGGERGTWMVLVALVEVASVVGTLPHRAAFMLWLPPHGGVQAVGSGVADCESAPPPAHSLSVRGAAKCRVG